MVLQLMISRGVAMTIFITPHVHSAGTWQSNGRLGLFGDVWTPETGVAVREFPRHRDDTLPAPRASHSRSPSFSPFRYWTKFRPLGLAGSQFTQLDTPNWIFWEGRWLALHLLVVRMLSTLGSKEQFSCRSNLRAI